MLLAMRNGPRLCRDMSKAFNTSLMGCYNSADLERLVLRTSESEFNSINVSTAIHRLGKLRKAENFTTPRSRECLNKLFTLASRAVTMNPQTLVNIMMGIANGRLALDFPPFLYRELERNQRFLRDFSPQAMSTLFMSFAALGLEFPQDQIKFYLAELERRDASKFHDLDFPQLLMGLATLRLHSPVVFNRLSGVLTSSHIINGKQHQRLMDFPIMSLTNVLWSYAEMGIPNKLLVSTIAQCLVKMPLVKEADHKFIIKLMWSFACLDELNEPNVQQFFQIQYPVFVERIPLTSRLYLQTRLAWNQTHSPDQPSALLQKLDSAAVGTQVEIADSLVRHRRKQLSTTASRILDFFQQRFSNDQAKLHFPINKGLYVDLCFPEKKLVVELETPNQYTVGGEALLGSSLFFRRLVKREGYQLVVINLKQFETNYSAREQTNLLETLARQIQEL
ncbi:hypothetical protein BASA81_015395 [Batrachochytrium salamandrivorans]|nr:hypothetical protein BASA81_015395 [Batrachochytrium salamandrivorans]